MRWMWSAWLGFVTMTAGALGCASSPATSVSSDAAWSMVDGAASDASPLPVRDDGAALDGASVDAGALDAAPDRQDATLSDGASSVVADAASMDAASATTLPSAPQPRFRDVSRYATTIPGHGDPADVYYPSPADLHADPSYRFPIAVMLQGANVDRAQYEQLARAIAGYGFIVVVANHQGVLGLLSEQQQLIDALAHLRSEAERVDAPVHDVVDVATLLALGHSFGGVTGLGAVEGTCEFPFCTGSFARPSELVAAAFFGTNLGDAPTPIHNAPIAVALIQGSLDGKALPAQAQATYAQLARPRALFTIAGANHYGVCNQNNPPGAEADARFSTGDQNSLIAANASAAGWFLRAVTGDAAAKTWLAALDGQQAGLVGVTLELSP